MKNRIKIDLKITHGGNHVDFLTKNQILKLHDLLQNCGKKRVNNKWYEVSSTSFVLYKSKKFGGPNYAFNLATSKKIINNLIYA